MAFQNHPVFKMVSGLHHSVTTHPPYFGQIVCKDSVLIYYANTICNNFQPVLSVATFLATATSARKGS